MIEIHQDFVRLSYKAVSASAMNINDKPNTAGVVFVRRVIKALSLW